MKKCSVEGCMNKYHGKGFCGLHLARIHRGLDPKDNVDHRVKYTKEELSKSKTCECGCNEIMPKYDKKKRVKKYIYGHSSKVVMKRPEVLQQIRELNTGQIRTDETRELQRQLKLGDKNPNFGKPRDPITIEKIRLSNLGKTHVTPENKINYSNGKKKRFENRQNHPMWNKHHTEESKQKARDSWTPEMRDTMAILQTNKVKKYKDTDSELAMDNILQKCGILYEKQKTFTVGKRLHAVDKFIEPNVCIECDGERWHNYPHGTQRDKFIDDELHRQGMVVLRFWRKDILRNPDQCLETIRKALRGNRGDVQ